MISAIAQILGSADRTATLFYYIDEESKTQESDCQQSHSTNDGKDQDKCETNPKAPSILTEE